MNQKKLNWPRVPDFPKDAFKGTSENYADFRPSYPGELIDDLSRYEVPVENRRLLDLGCGPGRTTFPLLPYFDEAWAVDPEKEMLEEAGLRTPDDYKDKVHWVHAAARYRYKIPREKKSRI